MSKRLAENQNPSLKTTKNWKRLRGKNTLLRMQTMTGASHDKLHVFSTSVDPKDESCQKYY